jgi:predicted Zn-dependent protease
MLWLAACAADQTGALVTPTSPLPPATPRVLGGDAGSEREHARLVAAFGGEYRSAPALAFVSEVTRKLVASTDRPDEAYRVTILDSPSVNAFALPSGRLYVTRGLLGLANDTSELAAVLAHEIAHVTLRHANARSELALQSALVSRVVADVLNDPAAGAMILDQSRFKIAGFSRAQELEADQIGVRTLARAGYDPYGAARFLTSLGRSSALAVGAAGSGARAPDILSSHPSTPERVSLATQAARRIGAPGLGREERQRYLAAVDGITYGDNPADGTIRGSRFVHPRLGVAFEAPEGFALENTSRAVLGATADGNRRFLFDALDATDGQSLEAVLKSSWNDAIATGSVENLTVNGAPAALAASQGKEWSFRMAAIRVGSTTFRLVLAGRANDGALDRLFRASLQSVRQLEGEEARAIRPLRVQLVTAAPGDTVEGLAARMVVPNRAVERFLVLNGIERGAALRPGEAYKIVAE